MNTEEKISAFAWIQVGMVVLIQVLLVAFVIGFIVGHFLTGSHKTVEVAPNGQTLPRPFQSGMQPDWPNGPLSPLAVRVETDITFKGGSRSIEDCALLHLMKKCAGKQIIQPC